MISYFKPIMFFILSNILFLSIHSSSASDDTLLNNFIQCLHNSSTASSSILSTFITNKNASYDSILHTRISNRMYMTPDTPRPLGIIEPAKLSHIQATILCAKQQGLLLRVRSGGHDFEASSSVSTVPYVILDMLSFRAINIEMGTENTAWVEAGATLGELYYKLGETSNVLGFSASVCHAVGAGGHFSGGGYGNMLRKYGLASDNVVDAKIMDANGVVRDRKSMGEDVFWALRGGGGGSFGVILSWKVKLAYVPERVTVFNVKRSREQGGFEAIYQWQIVAPSLPNEVFIRVMAGVVNGTYVENSFIAMFLGKPNQLVSLLGKSFPELGLKLEECHEMSWVDSTIFWFDMPIGTPSEALLNRLNGSDWYSKIKSDYVQRPIPKEGLESIWNKMLKLGVGSMKWNPYGGIMNEISESDSPFPHRTGNLYLIQYLVIWAGAGNETENKYLSIARELYEAMTPYVSKNPREAFLNYRDHDIGVNSENRTDYKAALVYGRKFFKNNFVRLVKAMTIIDPENFFRNEQSIPPRLKRE